MNEINRLDNMSPASVWRSEFRFGGRIDPRVGEERSTVTPREPDRVEFSALAVALAMAPPASNIRADKVVRIKALIENGSYDVDGKLDFVADRLAEDLARMP